MIIKNIRQMDAAPIEDFLREVKEKIANKKGTIKEQYQEQLSFLED